jgi:hypothetical protein
MCRIGCREWRPTLCNNRAAQEFCQPEDCHDAEQQMSEPFCGNEFNVAAEPIAPYAVFDVAERGYCPCKDGPP